MTLSVSFSPADPERYLSPTDLGTMRKIFIHFYISFSAIPLLLPCPALRGNALFLISPWFLLPNRRQCVLLSIPAKHFIFPVRSFSFSFGSAALRLPSLPCPLHSLGDHCHTTSQKPPSFPPSSLLPSILPPCPRSLISHLEGKLSARSWVWPAVCLNVISI